MQAKRRLKSATHSGVAEGGWAVSYADFLMVLLSFFIVFFSFDEKSSLHNIIVSLNQHSGATASGTYTTGGPTVGTTGIGGPIAGGTGFSQEKFEHSVITKVSTMFKNAKVETFDNKERIVVDLPNDIYRKGQFNVPVSEITTVIKALEPYQNDISITIMGHADSAVFQHVKKLVVKDNLTLASLRAAYASTYLQQALPKAQVWIQASETSQRKSRSLSFVIEPRKGGTL